MQTLLGQKSVEVFLGKQITIREMKHKMHECKRKIKETNGTLLLGNMGFQVSTTNWHLPRALPTAEQQRHLPSASMETEPHAAIAVDLHQPLREFRVE